MIKQVPDFPHYFVDEQGNIYSDFNKNLVKIKPWLDSKGNYLQVGLMKDGKRHRLLVHRLVAITFVPNPQNLPEVNHKDKENGTEVPFSFLRLPYASSKIYMNKSLLP